MDLQNRSNIIPIGYSALIENYNLKVIPHYRQSYVALKGDRYTHVENEHEVHVYKKEYQLSEDTSLNHIEFAIKYDGINLEILSAIFQKLETAAIIEYIKKSPTGKYARMIWFLYEWLMSEKLPIDDINMGNYINLLNDKNYFVTTGSRSKRHRIINNMLGNKAFCPTIRKTSKLDEFIKLGLDNEAEQLINAYDPNIVARASQYLFTKETLSSYAIESEKPSKKREERYIQLLQSANRITELDKDKLMELQQATVDPRFANVDYRSDQNYVGETINPYMQKIHYVCPKPSDVEYLMQGLFSTLKTLLSEGIHPVVIASTIAFGFVFIHPFDDGNGRLHRFLLHYVLSLTNFTPNGTIFPISAVMLNNIRQYDEKLELFSKPLLQIIDYDITTEGVLSVKKNTLLHYQFLDYTKFVEYIFECIQITIKTEFKMELEFLVNYDDTKSAIQEIVDMPDSLIDLMIKFVYQNQGKLSKNKRVKYFEKLTDDEISQMENVIAEKMLD